ncbi:MAG: purine-binding chemotaxis protein CheW [Nitrospirae bacterium]|nr:purine-binding chemotaxis protein CheW [Nitrospirota bacterium]
MDLVNIRKKAQQEKAKEEKPQDSTQKQVQGKTEDAEANLQVEGEITEEAISIEKDETGMPLQSGGVELSQEIREEIQEIPSLPYSEEESVVEVISFRLGDEIYGVKIDYVREILKPLEITSVPRTPSYLKGVTSLRGEIIPVFDLKERLGLEGIQQDKKRRILILSIRNETIGAVIDEVLGVIKLLKESIDSTPTIITGIEADFLEGISLVDDRFIGLLNVEEVMKI